MNAKSCSSFDIPTFLTSVKSMIIQIFYILLWIICKANNKAIPKTITDLKIKIKLHKLLSRNRCTQLLPFSKNRP